MSDLVDYVNKRLIGRVALNGDDQAELLAEITGGPGIHVEIGCLWGGTAILAALAKRHNKSGGHVFSIDVMMGGFWDTEDPEIHKRPHPSDALENILRFNLAGDISIIRANSHPWPLAPHLAPNTALIDGDHSYEGCLRDWHSLRDLVTDKVMFHDYHEYYPGVRRVVDNLLFGNPAWREYAHVGRLIVFERVKQDAVGISHFANIQQAVPA